MQEAPSPILRRKIDAAAGAGGQEAPREALLEVSDAYADLFRDAFGGKPVLRPLKIAQAPLATFFTQNPGATFYRAAQAGDGALLVAAPARFVILAADGALQRSLSPPGAATITALDRQLAAPLILKIAGLGRRILSFPPRDDAGAAERLEAIAAAPDDLILDRSFSALVVATIEGALAGGEESFRIAVAAPVERQKSDAPPIGDDGARWRAAIAHEIGRASVEIRALLGRADVSIDALLDLKPGEIIPLRGASIDRIAVEAAGAEILSGGRLGDYRGRRAIQVS